MKNKEVVTMTQELHDYCVHRRENYKGYNQRERLSCRECPLPHYYDVYSDEWVCKVGHPWLWDISSVE